jgi:hypothetical protein
MFTSAVKVLAVRNKYIIVAAGVSVILLFSGFRQAGFLSEIAPIISVAGCFILCFGLIMESNLKLHNYMLSSLINYLKGKKRKNYLKYLKTTFSRDKSLKALITDDIVLYDNPDLSNYEEKNKYDKIILLSYKWYRKHVKRSKKFLTKLKKSYNQQSVLTRRLNLFLI